MRLLITGATGFIGRHLCAALLTAGHQIVAAVRDPASAQRRFPGIEAVRIDMMAMTAPHHWQELLRGIDAVINCAGILQSRRGQSARVIHVTAPAALFDACLAAGVRRVIQISAVSADLEAGTEYALSKRAGDEHLRGLDLDWVVLRPSLVYGSGSYGGTSMLRGLAGLPFCIPLVGDGGQQFQPIHVDDLAETVRRALEDPMLIRRTLDPVGPEILTLRQIVERLRAWLDLPPVPMIPIPLGLIRRVARIGDVLEWGPLCTTSVDQIVYGNIADAAAFEAAIGFRPRSMAQALREAPSHVQDRWHARLYVLRPMLSAALFLLWLGSGIAGMTALGSVAAILEPLGISNAQGVLAGLLFSLADLALAGALLLRPSRRLGLLQFALVAAYTLGLGVILPGLWLDPFGRLLKNLPILATIAVWTVWQDER
jgi:uncharacterized protein YbjT (DUF2867 family)